ncbi:MAG: hypothetical protein ACD_22C00030G0008 [uncultured bacterium]|nr:MAG: hypothetical protein ACD_22C00030G0008 [uncultured bacterium]
MYTQFTDEFLERNQRAFSLIGVIGSEELPIDVATNACKIALATMHGKIRPNEWISVQDSVVGKFFNNPVISDGLQGISGTKYRQVVPGITPIGIYLGETETMMDVRIAVDECTRWLTTAAGTAIECGFVAMFPELFLDKLHSGIYKQMLARGINIKQSHLVSPTLFSRFDGVWDVTGKLWLVDVTNQSGGIDTTGIQSMIFDEITGHVGYFDYKWAMVSRNLSKWLGEFTILGGSPLRRHCLDRLRENEVEVTAMIPGVLKPDFEAKNYPLDMGDFVITTRGLTSQLRGIKETTNAAFWWEGLGMETPQMEKRSFEILKAIDDGRIQSLNHPVIMKVVEAKSLIPLVCLPGPLKILFEERYAGDFPKNIPHRFLVRLEIVGNQLQGYLATGTTWKLPGIQWENLGIIRTGDELLQKLELADVGGGMLKPATGMGAAGIMEVTRGCKLPRPKKSGMFVFEPLIKSLRISSPNILNKGDFTEPLIPRVEVYTQTYPHNGNIGAEIAKMQLLFNPGREDHRVHGSSGCFVLPVGVSDF